MKPQAFLSILSIVVLTLACILPAVSVQAIPTLPVVEATKPPASNTVIPPTNTPHVEPPTATLTLTSLPTDTPTITPTPTPSEPVLTPAKDPVNCRFGPGIEWLTIGALNVGETAFILARTDGGKWWFVRLLSDPNITCWVAASVTVPSGNYEAVGVIEPPQALVTRVSLVVKPIEITVPGCSFPYTPVDLKGSITTNGPAIVEWHWETSQGNISPSNTLNFDKYDTQTVSNHVKYAASGSYWVKLVVTKPNKMTTQAKYKVVCGP